MTDLNYIGADELVFNNDIENGIHSGGFSVKSIMLKGGMSPILTVNNELQMGGNSNNVSDLFDNLAVPNWVLSYNSRIPNDTYNMEIYDEDYDEPENNVISDDIYNRLLELVKAKTETGGGKEITSKKRNTRRKNKKYTISKKITRKHIRK